MGCQRVPLRNREKKGRRAARAALRRHEPTGAANLTPVVVGLAAADDFLTERARDVAGAVIRLDRRNGLGQAALLNRLIVAAWRVAAERSTVTTEAGAAIPSSADRSFTILRNGSRALVSGADLATC